MEESSAACYMAQKEFDKCVRDIQCDVHDEGKYNILIQEGIISDLKEHINDTSIIYIVQVAVPFIQIRVPKQQTQKH